MPSGWPSCSSTACCRAVLCPLRPSARPGTSPAIASAWSSPGRPSCSGSRRPSRTPRLLNFREDGRRTPVGSSMADTRPQRARARAPRPQPRWPARCPRWRAGASPPSSGAPGGTSLRRPPSQPSSYQRLGTRLALPKVSSPLLQVTKGAKCRGAAGTTRRAHGRNVAVAYWAPKVAGAREGRHCCPCCLLPPRSTAGRPRRPRRSARR